jgi:hypothetical protein
MNASHTKSKKTLNIWNIMHEVEMQNKLKHGGRIHATMLTTCSAATSASTAMSIIVVTAVRNAGHRISCARVTEKQKGGNTFWAFPSVASKMTNNNCNQLA